MISYKQKNKLLEIKDYDRKYYYNNVIVETRTYFLCPSRFFAVKFINTVYLMSNCEQLTFPVSFSNQNASSIFYGSSK